MNKQEYKDMISLAGSLNIGSKLLLDVKYTEDKEIKKEYLEGGFQATENAIKALRKYDRISRLPQVQEIERALSISREKYFLFDRGLEAAEIIRKNSQTIIREVEEIVKEVKEPLDEEGRNRLISIIKNYRDLKKEWEDLLGRPDTTESTYIPLASKFNDLLKDISEVDYAKKIDIFFDLAEDRFSDVVNEFLGVNPRSDVRSGVENMDILVRNLMEEYKISDEMIEYSQRIKSAVTPVPSNKQSISVEPSLIKVPKYFENLKRLEEKGDKDLPSRSKINRPVSEIYDILQEVDQDLMTVLYGIVTESEYKTPDKEGEEIRADVIVTMNGLKNNLDDLLTQMHVEAIDKVSTRIRSYARSKLIQIKS